MEPSILLSIENSIARITLNRPGKLNAFNREMALLLQEALQKCAAPEIRCVLLTGAGKSFSAGQDLAEVVDPDGPGMNRILSEHYNPIILAIKSLKKPVVAAVNGVAAGAGANMALSCDIVIAAKSASFIQAFSKIGLIPDSGGTYFLPRLIGRQKATAFMMLGDKISAAEAERCGMIYQYFEDGRFAEETEKIVIMLANLPTTGLAYTKMALQHSEKASLADQLDFEDQWQQKAALTNDFKEGVNAFLEKRQPKFKGN